MLDNFVNCETEICDIGGRSGGWFSYASADINQGFGIGMPSSAFQDRACAAWSTGGPSGNTAPSTFAGIGFNLVPAGSSYNLSGYTGITVSMESGQAVFLVVTDASGGLFGANMAGGGSGAQSYSVPLADMMPLNDSQTTTPDFAHATQVEFDSQMPTSYGFAIYSVSLYY